MKILTRAFVAVLILIASHSLWAYEPEYVPLPGIVNDHDEYFPMHQAHFSASIVDTAIGAEFRADRDVASAVTLFDYTIPFGPVPGSPATWDLLLTGKGDVALSMIVSIPPDCGTERYPEARIDMAELVIEGEFPVGADQSTWGSIKSLLLSGHVSAAIWMEGPYFPLTPLPPGSGDTLSTMVVVVAVYYFAASLVSL
jgi:hypothetical protein